MDLRTTQLKDTYGNLVTTGTTAGAPTEGGLQNGQGTLLTKVGIGTSSISGKLDIKNSNAGFEFFPENSTDTNLIINFDRTTSTYQNLQIRAATHQFLIDASEKMRIDTSGNVGIGETNPTNKLHISSPSFNQLLLERTGTAGAGVNLKMINSDGEVAEINNTGEGAIQFKTGGSEAMRIDSSGNVLVGTTDNSPVGNNVSGGIGLFPNGSAQLSRDGGIALLLNRKTSDGTIADFRKDGSTVGSIGTLSSHVYIGKGDTGLRFVDSLECIEPFDTSTPTIRDAGIDLGRSASRFKDLYLSGSVYLGGTTSANALDDYEEGTHDVTLTCTTSGTITLDSAINALSYTKIGRIMHVTGQLSVTSVSSPVGNIQLSLPTAIADLTDRAGRSSGSVIVTQSSSNVDDFFLNGIEGDAFVYIQKGGSTAGSDSAQEFSGDEFITLNFSYVSA